MSKQIKVIVSGRTGSGKTAISEVIVRALMDAGFDVGYADQDGTYRSEEANAKVIESLIQNDLGIIVEQHQALVRG